MAETLILELPFPVSTNTYWRHNRGVTHISNAGKSFRQSVNIMARGVKAPDGRLQVGVMLYPPDKRKRDLDNFGGKSLLDSLVSAKVIVDDSIIDRLVIVRGPIAKGGKCRVYISTVQDLIEEF
jgi:crossover junction endodeoxyribonuclease RusA